MTKIEDTKTIESGVIELGISDQSLVYICIKIEKPEIIKTRHYKNFCASDFQYDLSQAFGFFTNDLYTNNAWRDGRKSSYK